MSNRRKKKLKRTIDRNDYSFIIVKILDFMVTEIHEMSRNTQNQTINVTKRMIVKRERQEQSTEKKRESK